MVKYLRAANVKDGALDLSDVKEMNFSPSEQARFSLRTGDVLVTEGSGSLGAVGASAVWASEITDTVCFQNTLLRLRPRSHKTDGRFLAWWARAAFADGKFSAIASGANIYHLSAERVKGLACNLPPLDEQCRIADFLDAETARFDSLLLLRKRQLGHLDLIWTSRLAGICSDLVERYGVLRLKFAIRRIEQGWSPQCEEQLAGDNEWGVVKAGCVNGGVFRADQHKRLPEDVDPIPYYELQPGDLLMNRASGSPDLIGSIGIVPDDVRSHLLLCDKVYRIVVDRRIARPDFIATMLRRHESREMIRLGISGAEGMANNIPTSVVKNLEIPNAPLKAQDAVVASLQNEWERQAAVVDALGRQLDLLAERRQALITAAVTGQIDVTTARGFDQSEVS